MHNITSYHALEVKRKRLKINRLLIIFGVCAIYFISCKNEAQLFSLNADNTTLDTNISIDQMSGTIIEVFMLHLNELKTSLKANLIFYSDIYGEKIEIKEIKSPIQEIVSMDYIPKKYKVFFSNPSSP